MKKNFTQLLKFILLVIILTGFGHLYSYSQEYKNGIQQGTIRIKIKPTLAENMNISKSKTTGIISTGIKALDRLNTVYSVTDMKRVFRYSPKFEEKHKKYGLNLWYEITVNPETSPLDVVKEYGRLQEIDKSEPILERVLIDGTKKPVYLSKSTKGTAGEYFNDPYLSRQWHYNNTGQSGGTPGSDINLYKAWDITKGSKNVIVSIHDQGVDVDHEDLKDAMWINETELNGVAGVDDDGNGYKDDIYGFNFAKNMGTIDAMPHGTHVSGTIGAVNNNGIGVCGIAGGSGTGNGVRIMSCQILGGTGDGNIADSYVYAADMGSLISQNSWGYSSPEFYEQAVLDAIDYFIAEAGNFPGSLMKGGVVFFAAGNSSWDYPSYPGYYQSCISVSALNASSHLTVYSNYGTWVDIAAPGGQSEDDANIDPNSPFRNGVLSTLDNDSYGFMDGTSMACPHISGVAALIVSKFGGTGFTNAELKNRLLTGTRYIDDIPENVPYAGKMGSGEADALLALATNNNIAPNKINDLTLTGIAQDFANLNWTVPSDNDDIKPVGFEILYSTQEITLATLSSAKSMIINSRMEPGVQTSIEIPYLKPLTKYYFSVRAFDRWGNKAELSNAINGTTNAGPDAQIDPNISSLDLMIDASIDPNQSQSFNLLNNGEGLLKWDATTHHQYAYPSSLKQVNFPKIQPSHVSNGKNIVASTAKEASRPVSLSIDNPANGEMYYLNPNSWNLWIIGETDTTYTNSEATRFMVTDANGFNLTNVAAYLVHKENTGPIILEVYEGEQIADAKIVYKQEVSYSSDYGYTPISLDEQLFFEQGKYFWIVFHVPAMNKYPLGAGLETNKDDSKNCYYSSDLGKTWNSFEDVYYDNQLVWAVYALSQYQNIDKYIVLSPENGSVTSNSSTSIDASVDATNMVNGDYHSKIVINTNETEEPLLGLPVNLTISGHKPVINSSKRIDAGGVLVGSEKTFEVKLQNTGLGSFHFADYGYDPNWNQIFFESNNPQFTYVSGLNSFFEAKSEQTVKFKFKPTIKGNSTAAINIKDDKGNTYSFELFGYGIDPPVMVIAPSTATYNGLAIGQTISGQFNINNTGNYSLDYFVPAFADGSNMAEIPSNVHKFGYTKASNPAGINPAPVYNWTDISTTGTDITSNLNDAFSERFTQVDLGFEFPFFGKNESSVYVSRYSTLSFDTEGYIWSMNPIRSKWEGLPDRIISVTGFQTSVETSGHIYYKRFPDKFIVQWENVPISGTGTGTYQAVLRDNGDINIYIKDLTPESWATMETIASSSYIGIEDQTKNDALLIHDFTTPDNAVISNGTAIEFINPGQGLFTTLTHPSGTVPAGGSVTLEYTINTDNLYVANYAEKLVVISNDPIHNPGLHTANFNITSGGAPNIIQSATDLNFGQVFQNDVKAENFFIGNTGKAPATIVSASFANGNYIINGTFPQVLKPGRSLFYDVNIKTANKGILNDVLTLTTNEPKTYKINLSGEITDAPKLSTNITDITETLASGDSKTVSLIVNNPGSHDLDFAPVGNSWMDVSEKTGVKQVSEIPAYTYQFKSSKDESGPAFNWVEITAPENKVTVGELWNGENPWSAKIDLPFTFNFYGNEYNYLYVGYNGLISFTPDQALNPFGGSSIPNIEVPNNFIAALYGFIGSSWIVDYPNTGYYFHADSEKAVIEFADFNTGFSMSGPMSIEIIINKNGNIKFQYKLHDASDADVITPFGVIGVENIDGTDGLQIADHNYTYRNELAYELYPAKKYTVPAGQSKEFNVNISAKELFADQYTDELKLINNAPLSQGFSIPVNLTVTGSANIIAPASVDLGDVLVVETPESWVSPFKSYEKEFVIENSGSAKAEILQFDVSNMASSTVYAYMLGTDWFGNPIWDWIQVSNLPAMDWSTGQPIPLYLQPKSAMKYKVAIAPTSQNEISDKLSVITDKGTYEIALTANAFMPPVINLNSDTIKVFAQTTSANESKTLVLDNTAGGYELQYGLNIDYKRTSQKSSSVVSNNLKTSADAPKLLAVKNEGPINKTKSLKDSYNRQLSYESETVPTSNLGYGGSSAFYTSTAFQAPADGFNLTDVQTWYAPGQWLNSKIKVQIYSGGGDIYSAKLVHTQTYDYNITDPNTGGELLTIHLDKNIILYPNEKFFVTFGYESGAIYPQGVVTMPNKVRDRYLYSNGNGSWSDIIDAGTGLDLFGWMVRALEGTYQSAVWVSLSSLANDTIDAGTTGDVMLNFNAAYAKPGDNLANLTVNSNDPVSPKKVVTLLLHLNKGPEFSVEKTAYSVNENGILTFDVLGNDVEADNFTMSFKSKPAFVTGTFSSKTMSITCAPTYNDAGVDTITIEATDVLGNKSEASVVLTVKNVNRAPIVVNPIGNRGIDPSEMPQYKLSDVIADPDGESLVYAITSSNESVVNIFQSPDGVIFTAQGTGTTTITITGTDAAGLSATHSFTISVWVTGIDDVLADNIKFYPNPTKGAVNLLLPQNLKEGSTIRITNLIGLVLYEQKLEKKTSQLLLDISGFADGIYLIKVENQGIEKTLNVIKN